MRIFIISCFIVMIASCSGGGGRSKAPSGDDAPVLEKISISPYVDQLAIGTSVTLAATGIYSDQSTSDISDLAKWSTDDKAILIYDETAGYGTVRAAGAGASRVRVSLKGVDASLGLNVSQATLESLTVSPAMTVLPLGESITLKATGFFSDQSSQDLTGDVVWAVADSQIVTVTGDLLTGLAQGKTTVTGSYGNKSYTISVTVNDAVLSSLELSPARVTLALGMAMDMYVTGIYSDNSKRDVTGLAGWQSSNEACAAVSMVGGRAVLVGKETGQATVTAWLGDVSASSAVTVSQAELSRIEISTGDGVVPKGLVRQLRATGIYSDGTVKDLTANVLWGSSDETTAVVSNAWDSKGFMNALAVGTATVSAVSGEVSGSAVVTVGQAVLQKLDVSAGFQSIPAGLSRSVQATGLYSDQSLKDLTNDVTWASSNTLVALVGNGSDDGVVTGIVPGSTVISAYLDDLSAELAITVTDAVLVTLEIFPDSVSIPAGLAQQFTAAGLYSDNSISDVTREVLWKSSNKNVALPDNSIMYSGLFQTLSEGTCQVSAVLDEVSASVTIQVAQAELANVFISVDSVTVEKGMGYSLAATGLYTDSSTKDVTDLVLWASNAPDIAQVDNSIDAKGWVSGLYEGVAQVSATLNGFQGFCDISVTEAGLNHIAITSPSGTLAAGTSMGLSATGYFNDGSERDITDSVLWESSNMNIAVVSNANGEKGLLRTYDSGAILVTAIFKGETDQVSVTITDATLTSIEVLPADETLPSGFSLQYQAVGHFSDASEQDLTGKVAWTVNNRLLANISNLSGLKGRLYTFVPGNLTVSAAYKGLTGETNLTITGESLVAVQLAPNVGIVEEGGSAAMTLQGLFSDYSVRDISDDALWLTTNSNVFTVSNDKGDEGRISGESAGQAYVLAVYSSVGFVAPVFVISDVYMDSEQVDGGIQFKAYGDYNGDQYIVMTERVTWSSDDETILTVSNVAGEAGFAQIHQPGSCHVTATFNGTLSMTRGVVISSGE